MSNEETVPEDQEQVQDDEGTITPDEGDGAQGTDPDDTPEGDDGNPDPNIAAGDDEQDDKGEFYDDEKQFLEQWSLPGKPETLENAMDRLQTLEEENSRLKAHSGPDRTTQPSPQDKSRSDKSQDNGYFGRGIFKQHIDGLVTSGQLSPENAQGWRQQATMNDTVLDPAFKQIEETLNAMAGAMMSLGTAHRDSSWARFQHKGLGVDRQELDAIMDQRGLFDYTEALMQLAVNQNRPDLLGKIVTKAERRGEDKGRKRKLRRGGMGRGKLQSTGAPISKKYLNPDGSLNQNELNRLSTNESLKITDQFLASIRNKN